MSAPQAPPPSRDEIAERRRLINNGIASSGERFDDGGIQFEFLCECGMAGCDEIVPLTIAQYHAKRTGAVVAHRSSEPDGV